MKYPKIAIWRAFLPKKLILYSPTPTLPARVYLVVHNTESTKSYLSGKYDVGRSSFLF
jgi:hypothetical protein